MATLTGGEKLQAYLEQISGRLSNAGSDPAVRVGFLEGSRYPDGTSVPMVAAMNEFGGTIQKPPGQVTIYRRVSQDGTHFLKQGRFVKRSQANFQSTHAHSGASITIPPRPFFRNMIKKNGKSWGPAVATLLKNNRYDARKTLGQMGELIKGELQQSINETNSPPNAPSTIRRKGASKPLIDTGFMWQSVAYELSGFRSGSFGGIASAYGGSIGTTGAS